MKKEGLVSNLLLLDPIQLWSEYKPLLIFYEKYFTVSIDNKHPKYHTFQGYFLKLSEQIKEEIEEEVGEAFDLILKELPSANSAKWDVILTLANKIARDENKMTSGW